MSTYNIKDMVSGGKKVRFLAYRQKELWYTTECGFDFPVPIDDTGDGVFFGRGPRHDVHAVHSQTHRQH